MARDRQIPGRPRLLRRTAFSLAGAVLSATRLTSPVSPSNVIPVSIQFHAAVVAEGGAGDRLGSAPGGGENEQRRPSEPADNHEAAGGCAWLAAWAATCVFGSGAVLLAFVVVTGEGGPYGVAAIVALFVCGFGIMTLGAAAAMWAAHRLQDRSHSRRQTAAALTALAAAVAFLAPVVADLLGWLALPVEGWPVAVTGATLLVLAAVVAAERSERRPALAFAALWVLLLGTISYRAWTDLRVEVVWLGPSVVGPTPGQVGFTATRSGDFVVRF
jgi:MFS family permease